MEWTLHLVCMERSASLLLTHQLLVPRRLAPIGAVIGSQHLHRLGMAVHQELMFFNRYLSTSTMYLLYPL